VLSTKSLFQHAKKPGLWICGQSAAPIPAFALRAILRTARGKRLAFPTARPQAGGCPQAPQASSIGFEISNSRR